MKLVALPLALALASLQAPSVRERMLQGLELLRAGDREEARAIFESVIEDVPNHGPARLQLGELALARGDTAGALTHLEIAVQGKPLRPHFAWYLLARARRATTDLDGANEAIDVALAEAPDFLPARVERAELSAAMGDDYAALEHYRHAVEQAPDRADIHAGLATTARRVGAFGLARCSIERALELDPANPSLEYLRAAIEESAGDFDEAVLWAERARDHGFAEAALFLTLGNLYHEQMRLDDAMTALERALELDVKASESLASFALSALTAEQSQRFRILLERHVEAHPDSRNTLYGLGGVYLRENELERALDIFERLERLEPEASQVVYNLAMVHSRAGRVEKAKHAMERFSALRERENAEWERQNGLVRLRLDIADALDRGDAASAVELSNGIPGPERTVDDWLNIAEATSQLAEWTGAAESLDRALAIDPFHEDALEMRARVATELGADDADYRGRLQLLSPDCEPQK